MKQYNVKGVTYPDPPRRRAAHIKVNNPHIKPEYLGRVLYESINPPDKCFGWREVDQCVRDHYIAAASAVRREVTRGIARRARKRERAKTAPTARPECPPKDRRPANARMIA